MSTPPTTTTTELKNQTHPLVGEEGFSVIATRENLKTALGSVYRVATTKSSLPILGNILLSTEGGQVKLAATDLELGVVTRMSAKVRHEGSLTLPARVFVDFVGTNPDDTIELVVTGTDASVRSAHHHATMKGMDANEFPLIPPPGTEVATEVSASVLRAALADVVYAAAIDDARPVLGGVTVRLAKKQLVVAATDSYRLAERVIQLPTAAKGSLDVILPARSVAELIRILPDAESPVSVAQTANQLSFVFDSTQVVSRLIDGTFPDYQQIIPKEAGTTATLPHSQLVQAVKMADLFARDAAHHVRLRVGQDGLTLVSASSTAGSNEASVEATITGEPVEVAFNARYLLDALGALRTEQVHLSFAGADRPGVVRPVGDDGYLALVMPLRLDA